MDESSDWITGLSSARDRLGRSSTAERVADILRSHLIEGRVQPGSRLSEDGIAGALGVSRNTLREAFRLLSHERLLVHKLNRGVFVRDVTINDVVDIYRLRRILEVAAVRSVGAADWRSSAHLLEDVRSAVNEGQHAAEAGEWRAVGTANMHFHMGIAALAASPRINDLMRQLLAELRLVFHVMAAPRPFHEPYLASNHRIASLLEAGHVEPAAQDLLDYLHAAEQQLIEAYKTAAAFPATTAMP